MTFKIRWQVFVLKWLELAGDSYFYSFTEVLEKGIPPVHHYHNGSLESRGLGRLDWLLIAQDYWKSKHNYTNFY